MKRFCALLVILSICLPFQGAHAASKVGASCPTIGKSITEQKAILICVKSGSKKIWKVQTLEQSITAQVQKAERLTKLPKNVEANLLKARKDKSPWLDQICSVDFSSQDTPVCVGGVESSKKVIVVYGDSHASMWMSALDDIGKKYGYKVQLFAKLACPLVEVPIWSYQLNRPFTECTQWQQKVYPLITQLDPEIIIVTDQWKPAVVDGKKSDFDTPFMWEKEFPVAMSRIAKLAKRVYVIGNNPSLSQDPVDCASKPGVNLALCSAGRIQADNATFNAIEAKAAKSIGATYIDTVNWACTASLCPIVIGNTLAYFDQWHFSESYVQYLKPALESKLKLTK